MLTPVKTVAEQINSKVQLYCRELYSKENKSSCWPNEQLFVHWSWSQFDSYEFKLNTLVTPWTVTRLLCPWNSAGREYWSGLLFPSPRDLPNLGIEPRSPALEAVSLPSKPPGKPSMRISKTVTVIYKKKTSLFLETSLSVSSVRSLSRVQLFATPWTAARQASLCITNSRNTPKPMFIESMMPSNHLILLSSPSPSALNLCQHQGLFKWVSSLHQVAKVLEFQLQHQSLQWIPRTDLL